MRNLICFDLGVIGCFEVPFYNKADFKSDNLIDNEARNYGVYERPRFLLRDDLLKQNYFTK